ncbi:MULTISPECIES: helix-turn-helix domain-containing protein [Kitasatospora]|uniref:helix-turn-helix domain-containing protein n=1 Tax=Kitasatospora TaxID=2063 RepID=UPI000C70AD89|nr:pyridoxamine 5'-phosphate oxidase family protein [Kitasatospora sp. GP30]MDH6140448.1 nitroimidazol reductase NimA-like FMN-containing flavoprotein (pyridoxamine 5'-phosphate oxidase superfamily) [Kitasatospora sp. GP30]
METTPGPGIEHDPEVIAARVADRRAQLGLSPEQLARDAGMSPHYLKILLKAGPAFDSAGFMRIAAALGLSYGELLEGRAELPPGRTAPAPHPAVIRLTEDDCWDLLGTHGVGRIALPTHPGPAVFPVNYAVDRKTIVYRTDPRAATAVHDGAEVSFQADRIDEKRSHAWSVLLMGTAERVTDPDEVRRLRDEALAQPWAGGERPLWIRIRPGQVTGRRVTSLPGAA